MNKLKKTIDWDEFQEINDRKEVDKSFVGYKIYKGTEYLGVVAKVSSDKIIVNTSEEAKRRVAM